MTRVVVKDIENRFSVLHNLSFPSVIYGSIGGGFLEHGVMVAQQILVLSVKVRLLLFQPLLIFTKQTKDYAVEI